MKTPTKEENEYFRKQYEVKEINLDEAIKRRSKTTEPFTNLDSILNGKQEKQEINHISFSIKGIFKGQSKRK